MICRTLISICMAVIFLTVPAFAEDKAYEGEIGLKGIIEDVDGQAAKFNEYSETGDRIAAEVKLRYDNERYFLKFDGSTESGGSLSGGIWGIFRYNIYYNATEHNIADDARTFFSGIGSGSLTGTPNPAVDTWQRFDYSTERKKYGAGFKLDLIKPFFLDVSVSRENRDGISPATVGLFPVLELPEPIDYRSDTVSIEAGYSKKPFFASVAFYGNSFENRNNTLDFTPFGIGFTDTLTLPPDNTFRKISFNGAVDLPFNSRLNLNAGSATARSHEEIISFGPPIDFDGRVDTKNYDIVLTTNPVPVLNAKVYYKYFNKTNRSDVIDDGVINDVFDYRKTAYGAEFGIKLPAGFSASAGYRNYRTDFDGRIDADRIKDDIYSVSIRWKGNDHVAFTTGYEKLKRKTDLRFDEDPALPPVEAYLARYDIAPKDMDAVKFSVDIMPFDGLDITLGYRYKNNDYDHTLLGLRSDKRDEFSIDAGYSIGKRARLSAYLDYERVRSYQFQRQFSSSPDPSVQDPSNFNWDVLQKEKTLDFGAAAEIYIMPKKLTLKLQYDNVRSDGTADYTYMLAGALPPGSTNSNIDISGFDDYRKSSFLAKLVYDISKSFSVSAGYLFEKYTFNDILTDGYQHVIGGFPGGYLTGGFGDPSYRANVVFLGVTYRF